MLLAQAGPVIKSRKGGCKRIRMVGIGPLRSHYGAAEHAVIIAQHGDKLASRAKHSGIEIIADRKSLTAVLVVHALITAIGCQATAKRVGIAVVLHHDLNVTGNLRQRIQAGLRVLRTITCRDYHTEQRLFQRVSGAGLRRKRYWRAAGVTAAADTVAAAAVTNNRSAASARGGCAG